MALERYTHWLMDASPEFPIHFLKIYRTTWVRGGIYSRKISRCVAHKERRPCRESGG
jgi:hypothetical protein